MGLRNLRIWSPCSAFIKYNTETNFTCTTKDKIEKSTKEIEVYLYPDLYLDIED